MVTRRGFLKGGGLALLGVGMMGGIPGFLAGPPRVTGLYVHTKKERCWFVSFKEARWMD
jgi:hypothetical protein